MRVGDLVQYGDCPVLGLIIKQDGWATLVMWCRSGDVEDTLNYGGMYEWKIVSEGR